MDRISYPKSLTGFASRYSGLESPLFSSLPNSHRQARHTPNIPSMSHENEIKPFLEDDSYTPRLKNLLKNKKGAGFPMASTKWSRNSASILSHAAIFLTTSIVWGSLFLLVWSRKQVHQGLEIPRTRPEAPIIQDAKLLRCGNSTLEAKGLGCQYDILSNHWVPNICLDQEAVEMYQSDGSWYGYSDENRTQLITIETMAEMPFYYTSARDHIVHCAMLWRNQFNVFIEGRKNLDTIIASKEHTEHCAKYLIDMSDWGTDFWNMPIKVFPGYAGCWVKDD